MNCVAGFGLWLLAGSFYGYKATNKCFITDQYRPSCNAGTKQAAAAATFAHLLSSPVGDNVG